MSRFLPDLVDCGDVVRSEWRRGAEILDDMAWFDAGMAGADCAVWLYAGDYDRMISILRGSGFDVVRGVRYAGRAVRRCPD